MAQTVLVIVCVAVAAHQLRRVPRLWAFLLLFIALMPKVPVAVVPGNTTPIRVDDLIVGMLLLWWAWNTAVGTRPTLTRADVGRAFQARLHGDPERVALHGLHGDPERVALHGAGEPAFTRTVPPSPATLFLLVYWYAAAVCTLVGIAALTTGPLTGALHAGRLIEYGLLYYLFYTSIGPDDLGDFVAVIRTSLLLVCGLWLAQHWTHAPAGGPQTPWATLYPTFSATYDFGGYLMLATVLLYALWSTGASRGVWTTTALAAGVFVTASSESRASLLGLACVVAIDIIVRARWWAVLAMGLLAAAAPFVITSKKMLTLVSGVVALVTTFNVDVIRQAFMTDPSLALRLRNWRAAIEHWLARPFLGDGLGGYLAYTRQYDLPASPDGWYVRMLADTGVVGFVAFVLLMAALLWTLVASLRTEIQPLRRAIVYGAALAVVAASVSAVLVDTFVSYKIMGVFWTIVACGTRVAAEHGAAGATGVASNRSAPPALPDRLAPPAPPDLPGPSRLLGDPKRVALRPGLE
jgi:O-antigen ligase